MTIVASVAAPARADVLDTDAMTSITDVAMAEWKMQHLAGAGAAGLQQEVSACYRHLGVRPLQRKAAHCLALDYFSFQDAKQWPVELQPPYFREKPWAWRNLHVISQIAPSDRAQFVAALQAAMDESARKTVASDAAN